MALFPRYLIKRSDNYHLHTETVIIATIHWTTRRADHDSSTTRRHWMADAGVPVHHLRKIAGHGSLTTTQRYLHPDRNSVSTAATLLSRHLVVSSHSTPA